MEAPGPEEGQATPSSRGEQPSVEPLSQTQSLKGDHLGSQTHIHRIRTR